MLCQYPPQHSDPVIRTCECVYIHTYVYTHSCSNTIFHRVLSQDVWYNSVCSAAGPHCLSILNAIVCIYQPPTPHPSQPHPWQTRLFFMSVSLFLFCRWVHLLHIWIPLTIPYSYISLLLIFSKKTVFLLWYIFQILKIMKAFWN